MRRNIIIGILSVLISGLWFMACGAIDHNPLQIDLSGEWRFRIDSLDRGISENWSASLLDDVVTLPGTMDTNGKGDSCRLDARLEKTQLLHLTRKYSYVGPAWYQRDVEITEEMANRPLSLELGRVLWQSRLWIDGEEVDTAQESLTTPHRFSIPALTKGKHTLTLRIDNSKRYDISVNDLAHAYTNNTQVMWNGVLGNMTLTALPDISIDQMAVYATDPEKPLLSKLELYNHTSDTVTTEINLNVGKVKTREKVMLLPGLNNVEISMDCSGAGFKAWYEFSPAVYNMVASVISSGAQKSVDFGFREVSSEGTDILVNNKPVFLRGTLECCIFPLTGTPPTDEAGWEKVFSTAKEYGLNHLRFHSWCPPEAAFKVADKKGFYLQVELPQWSLTVGQDSLTTNYIYKEYDRIIREYGSHPSFVMMTCGNELQPDFDTLNGIVEYMRKTDPRHLYAASSFTFEKGHGAYPEPHDQFFITQWTNDGWVRGQGVFDSESPRFDKNFDEGVKNITVPLVTHEIGQYSVYPNLSEIDKYTGTLMPLNFMAVKKDMESKGLIGEASDWTHASGKLAAILYKEEIERAMKTKAISGFQLLDLHDFPGQGTALVGLLDAFWDSKGVIEPEEFRQFCSPVVPLAYFGTPIYRSGDVFNADISIANYSGENIDEAKVKWQLSDTEGKIFASGYLPDKNLINGENTNVGKVSTEVKTGRADKLIFDVSVDGTLAHNTWSIWVYPEIKASDIENLMSQIVVTDNLAKALESLEKGEKVLFSPDYATIRGLEGKFVPVFWSPVHFSNQAGTMGLLCDPNHQALKSFPTEMHSNWQWWDLLKHSTTVDIDSIPGAMPIIKQVDNFVNNRRLASIFEANCGKGKLIFSSIDLLGHNSDATAPERRQLLYSLLQYMTSPSFNPSGSVDVSSLSGILKSNGKYVSTSATSIYD